MKIVEIKTLNMIAPLGIDTETIFLMEDGE